MGSTCGSDVQAKAGMELAVVTEPKKMIEKLSITVEEDVYEDEEMMTP